MSLLIKKVEMYSMRRNETPTDLRSLKRIYV